MRSYQRFFAELKRRHVFKVAAIYGATAFVLLQLADLLVEALRLPADFLTMITVLLLLGFPVAVILAWAFEMTPEGVRRTDVATREELADLVAEPASRRWPAGLLALAGVAALVLGAWWVGRRSAPVARDDESTTASAVEQDVRPSIAVLPFADMSPEGDQRYFSDGMTEEILNTLAGIGEIKVTARSSAFAFRDQTPDIRAVGDSLGVDYVIEGSVRKAGDQLRITSQLIDASDGTQVWGDQYDRRLDDVFAIQTEIARSIAAALRVPLGLEEAGRLVSPTNDLEAYDLYLAGRARIRERGASLADASRLFEAAIARDSNWAPAWAGLAEARELASWYPAAWEEGRPASQEERRAGFARYQDLAETAARRALTLDPDLASARVALGSVHRNRMEHDRAEAEYLRAIDLDADNAEIYTQYAQLLMNVGRLDDGLDVIDRAIALDRLAINVMIRAAAQMIAGQYENALATVEEGLALDPGRRTNLAKWTVTLSLISLGRYEDLDPETFELENADLTSGRAGMVIRALRASSYDDLPVAYHHPVVLMRLGRPEEAARALPRMAREDPRFTASLLWMPVLDPIREHPAYLEAQAILNLEGREPQRPGPARAP